MISWQTMFLEALQVLDLAEAPHGLYGMRQAHAEGGRLPTLAYLLSSPASAGHFRSRGIHLHRSRLASGELSLRPTSREKVVLEVLGFATAVHFWSLAGSEVNQRC